MRGRLVAIGFVYACITLAWIVLGATLQFRTHQQDGRLRKSVIQLWGAPQVQQAPIVHWTEAQTASADGHTPLEQRRVQPLATSQIDVGLRLEHRRKGLLWYSTYRVEFAAAYTVQNSAGQSRDLTFDFQLPSAEAVYDDFHLHLGEQEIQPIPIEAGRLSLPLRLAPGQQQQVRIAYRSQGLDEWRYRFGDGVNPVSGFSLTMRTDFEAIDFPDQSLAPQREQRTATGWELSWQYDRLLTGADLGMVMPRRLNPGPWASQVSFAAPVSLFLFFFLLLVFTTLKQIRLHPMHYFFVGAAFFSFHLLLAYLVDHLSIQAAFILCSLVSLLLVASYMRLVVGPRFAFVEIGLAQLVYQVLFSCAFFFEGYAGLGITLLCVVTLFAVMQLTGRVDWEEIFAREGAPRAPAS